MNAPVINLPAEHAPNRRDAIAVHDPIPVLDTARFEHMQRIARIMAISSLVPETLRTEGSGDNKVALPFDIIFANCFLIVNQAVRWGMDPFAVVQCSSIVRGKPCYEGKLVAAVLEAKLGVELQYEWNDKAGDAYGVNVYAIDASGEILRNAKGQIKDISGTVADWKTTGAGSPWTSPGRRKNMLAYRGAREWARLYQPGVMLGVYSDDEMADLADNARAARAQNVTPPRPSAPQLAAIDAVETETATGQPAQVTTPPKPSVPPRPPVPPKPKAISEAAQPAFDVGALRKIWETAAAASTDIEELASRWDALVAPHENEITPPEFEDLLGIHRARENELAP